MRAVFPLSVLQEIDTEPVAAVECSLSRSAKRRLCKHDRQRSWMLDGVSTLNSISGIPHSDDDLIGPSRNATQVQCLDRIRRCYGAVPAPPAELTPAGAFSALRGSASGYDPDPSQGARVSFNLELCSMPPAMNQAHPVLDSLSGVHHLRVEKWRTHILRDEEARRIYMHSDDLVRPYLDPHLVRDPMFMRSF